jgi:small subunit ribosomal protein S20
MKQNNKRRQRNKASKTRVKSVSKELRMAAVNKDAAPDLVSVKFKTAQSQIDKAAKKGTIHKRAASRRISRLAKFCSKAAKSV